MKSTDTAKPLIFLANGEQIVSYGMFTEAQAAEHVHELSDAGSIVYDMGWTREELVRWEKNHVAPQGIVEWFDGLGGQA